MSALGVYIQVPFCASKCTFCNFSSKVAPVALFDGYCAAVEQELASLAERYEALGIDAGMLQLPADTVYVGGGTPSLLGTARLSRIFAALRREFRWDGGPREWSLEITPGSADDHLLSTLLAAGVNRLSIGAQSFNDRELRWVGRLHSSADTCDLVVHARRAGFKNINLDLIAGLPGESDESWGRTLEQALRLRPQHISVYLFEIDSKSRLGDELLRHSSGCHADAVPGEDFMADAYEEARRVLIRHGYLQYEISNFALPGYESVHNLKYWQREPYVGLGAGAHSFDGHHRWANESVPEMYQAELECGGSPTRDLRALSPVEQVEEFFFLGLRQASGIDLADAYKRWENEGVAEWERWERTIDSLRKDGWLEGAGSSVRLSPLAYLVSNEVFEQFLATPSLNQ